MLSRRLVGLVCVLTAASCVTIARAEEEEPTLDPSLARMYAASSADTLAAVARALEDAGLKIDARDEEAGLLRTKWKRYKAKRFPGLEIVPPRREWGQTEFEVQKIRVFVFVSQYVEPARVHITSRINFERFKPPQLVVRDHLPELSAWLFDRLEKELGTTGHAVPRSGPERWRKAVELAGEAGIESRCLGRPIRQPSDYSRVDEEARELTRAQPKLVYPSSELRREVEGRFELLIEVMEDGAPASVAIRGDLTSTGQLPVVSRQNARYFRYVPARIDGCAVPTSKLWTYDFVMIRKDRRQPLPKK